MIALGLLKKSYNKLIQTCLSIIKDAKTIDRIGLFPAKGVGVDTGYKPPITQTWIQTHKRRQPNQWPYGWSPLQDGPKA